MRYILLLAMLLLGVTGFAQDKTAYLGKGKTYLDISFNASDTVNESETYYVEIENFQDCPQMQDFYVDIDSVSGEPGVTIKAYGKKFSGDTYVQIGDSVVWAGTADTTFIISATTANRYRYLKVEFVADATDQQSLISDVLVKTWNTGGDLSTSALTLTGNLSVGGTTTLTGATTANGSITLGAGDDLIGSSTSDITINTTAFTVAGATGNTAVGGTLDVTGDFTGSGKVTATDSLCIGAFRFIIASDTLCSITGTDTLRIHPAR